MLTELRCDLFLEKSLTFKEGLNVVLGDDNATNSIGKSTLLMVIDFLFGGDTFIEKNKDVVNELGHHSYQFCFKFNGSKYYFSRETENPTSVYECDSNYNKLVELSTNDYTKRLKELYSLSSNNISFRALVGLYSRVWGKENIDVDRPLHTVKNQRAADCVDNLIKVFNRYNEIDDLSEELKVVRQKKEALSVATNRQIIPQVTSSQYKSNLNVINRIEREIVDIKNDLAKFALNINELINQDVLEAKLEKDKLLEQKLNLESKLLRVRRNIQANKFKNSHALKELPKFFPTADINKLEEIEDFHNSLMHILVAEFKDAESNLTSQLEAINEELKSLDSKIAEAIKSIDNPNAIVDRVFDLSKTLSNAKSENNYFESKKQFTDEIQTISSSLTEIKKNILSDIEIGLNNELSKLTKYVFDENRKSPKITLSESNYKYETFEDTGTGKAYSNLILLDLAVLNLTSLPFVIHDSLLYKNIENNAVSKLINMYQSSGKQSFISIDEINKYGGAVKILRNNALIQLRDDKVLYIKDWRKISKA